MDQEERRHIVVNQYLAALSSPNEETLAALASVRGTFPPGLPVVSVTVTMRARVIDDPEDRAKVYERSPATERNIDPRVRGVAVVVDVDSVVGGGPGGRVNLQRTAAE